MADEDPKSHPPDYAEKDPDTWVSGEDSMTGAQASYLKTLSEQADDADAYDDTTSKAESSKRIDALKSKLVKEAELYAERLDTYAGFSSINPIISPGGYLRAGATRPITGEPPIAFRITPDHVVVWLTIGCRGR